MFLLSSCFIWLYLHDLCMLVIARLSIFDKSSFDSLWTTFKHLDRKSIKGSSPAKLGSKTFHALMRGYRLRQLKIQRILNSKFQRIFESSSALNCNEMRDEMRDKPFSDNIRIIIWCTTMAYIASDATI